MPGEMNNSLTPTAGYGGYSLNSDGSQRTYDNGVTTDANGTTVLGYNPKIDSYRGENDSGAQRTQPTPDEDAAATRKRDSADDRRRGAMAVGRQIANTWASSAPNFDPAAYAIGGLTLPTSPGNLPTIA